MTTSPQLFLYPRLSIAFFLQLAIWGSWAMTLGAYAFNVLELTGPEIGWLYAAFPIGAVISPLFIGPIADRYFAAQRVVAVLHALGAFCLFLIWVLCYYGLATFPLLMALMLLQGICYAPTLALMQTVIFKHLPTPTMGPYVFLWGTIGWICVNLIVAAFFDGANTPGFFLVAAVCSLLLALYSGTLPDTPPRAPVPGEKTDALGLGALVMFRDPVFLIFAILVFLASIPASNYFFPAATMFLTERGYVEPVALMTLNQFSEIALMAALPFAIMRFGLKNVLLIGMAAWSIRYFLFATPEFALTVMGLLLHGFCYTFLYVASYMYAERKAPAELKASAQSLMVFLMIGVGQVIGSMGFGHMLANNPPKMTAMPQATVVQAEEIENLLGFHHCPECGYALEDGIQVPLPPWHDTALENSAWRFLNLSGMVADLMGGEQTEEEQEKAREAGRTLGSEVATRGNVISQADLNAMPETLTLGGVTYTRDDLQLAFAEVRELLGKPAGADITRNEWLSVQAHNWFNFWFYPAIWVALCFVAFLVLGKNPREEKAAEEKPEANKS